MLLLSGGHAHIVLLIAIAVTSLATGAKGFFPTDWREKNFGKGGVSHESQTKQVFEELAAKYFPDIKPLKKTMLKARDAIVKANEDVDDDQTASDKHFDGENFEGGQLRLTDLRQKVINSLHDGDGEGARESLGGALHTVQDFYAHSNWVEMGNSDINYDLGKPVSLSHATFSQRTCGDCGPANRLLSECHDCRNNTDGFTLLTSGYYFGEDSPPDGIAIPGYKCHHGGVTDNSVGTIWGVAFGDVTPGINKDSNNCFWSPHFMHHPTAVGLAIKATTQYMEDIISELNEKEKKLLFGVGATMAFAIDTTGSMADVISSARQQSIAIVNARLDTPDEPSAYVVAPFNDPTTGPVTVTSDFDTFQFAISSLFASGGGDCPELSMTGMLDAMSVMDGPADLFIMTDAAPKDDDLASEVVGVAVEKNINIHIFKFDSDCDDGAVEKRQDSHSNRVYASVAAATGGSYHSLPRGEVGSISGLLDILTKSDSTGILKIADDANSTTPLSYNVPVDSVMTEFSISVRGDGIEVSLAKPDGSALDLASTNVSSTVVSDGQFITVKSPVVGVWTVSVEGNGSFSLDASGVSSLHLSSFNFVALKGRSGHTGYFPITGQPAYDHDVAAIGVLDGHFSTASFNLRSPAGALVADAGMEPGSGEEGEPPKNSFFGEMRLSPGTLYAYCSGVDAAGAPFQRVLASVFTPFLSNSTVTGFNDTNPFLGLNDTMNGNTTVSISPTVSANSTSSSLSWSRTVSLPNTTTPYVPTSTGAVSSSLYSTPTAYGSSAKSYPHYTPSSHKPHISLSGVIYTHSDYVSLGHGDTVTEVTYTTTTYCPVATYSATVSGSLSYYTSHSVSTITLTTTSVILCGTCIGPNYPHHTGKGPWSSADASVANNGYECSTASELTSSHLSKAPSPNGSGKPSPAPHAPSYTADPMTYGGEASIVPSHVPTAASGPSYGPPPSNVPSAVGITSSVPAPYPPATYSGVKSASTPSGIAGTATGTGMTTPSSYSAPEFTGGAGRGHTIRDAIWGLLGVGIGWLVVV